MGLDEMTEAPAWSPSHPPLDFPLNNDGEFILESPKEEEGDTTIYLDQLSRRIREIKEEEEEEEEATRVVNSFQTWNFPTVDTHLHSRIRQIKEQEEEQKEEEEGLEQQYSRAIDSEQPNSLSDSSDYSQESLLKFYQSSPIIDISKGFCQTPQIEGFAQIRQTVLVNPDEDKLEQKALEKVPRISEVPRRKSRNGVYSLKVNQPAPAFPTLYLGFIPNALEGFETMNIDKMVADYKIYPVLHPTNSAEVFRCDIEQPEDFNLEPHWFQDTEEKQCWCLNCIQYRKSLSTGKQPKKHDYNKWCLCSSCAEFEQHYLFADMNCNFPVCVDSDQAQALAEEKEALTKLQNLLRSPIQESSNSEQLVTEAPQKSPSDPLCADSTAGATETREGSSELFNMIQENLWLESESESSESDFDFDYRYDSDEEEYAE